MTTGTPPPFAVHDVLAAGGRAPSDRNSQPWILREDPLEPGAIEVRGDPGRALPVSDPDHRAMRVACGAALVNMRLAVRERGRRAHVHLLPDEADPWSFARLRVGGVLPPTEAERALAAAVPRRRTHRRGFSGPRVSPSARAELRRAAETERGWLVWVDDPAQRRDVAALATEAHRVQRADPAWVAEHRSWSDRGAGAEDGLDARTAGPRPPDDDPWRVRDLTDGTGEPDRRDDDALVLVLVLGTFHDQPLAHLQAGQALERVLLTATVRGLAASFVAPPLEVPAVRAQLRDLLGGGLWPQAILRVGHGSEVVPTPRHPAGGS